MRTIALRMPASLEVSLLAALTTWLTLWSWTSFAEQSSSYLVPLFGACLLVAVVGVLLRSARLPALLVVLAQVLVLLAWLHHRWAGSAALVGVIPTGASLRLFVHTVHLSVTAAQSYAAPVPSSIPAFAPIMILAGSATAVLVDFLACGLRRAPLAGLPLLAAYTAPVSVLDGGVSWLKFAVAALAFLFLIASDEARRIAHWGHQLTGPGRVFDTQTGRAGNGAVWSSARKIGFTVTALAVVTPLLVPTFHGTIFGGDGTGTGTNGDAVSISNPMVDLRRDLVQGRDVPLLRVRTTDPDPSYLRISVLDTFDGQAWRPSGRHIPITQRADGLVSHPPGLGRGVATTRVPWSIDIGSNFSSRWLPAPYPVYSINAPGDWRYDVNTLDFIGAADHETTANVSYRLTALQVTPTAAQLADAGSAPSSVFLPYTALPSSLPKAVGALARSVTKGASTDFAKAVDLQQFFRQTGGFTYSLDRSPGTGVSDLLRFLSTDPGGRTGYCEQFAAAMAVMGRTLGIPSRVAVGFLQPTRTAKDTWVYSSHDLHAWPEMYFEGVGWVRFEPTPASRTGAVPAYTTERVPHTKTAAPTTSAAPAPTQNRIDRQSVAPGAATKRGGGSSGHGGGLLVGLVVVLLLALLALGPRLARALVRRRRWSAARSAAGLAEAAWAELRDSALDLGLAWDDAVTLRTRARELARAFGAPASDPGGDDALGRSPERGASADPEATRALDRLVRMLERARFSRGFSTDPVEEEMRADVQRCVAALTVGASRRRRTRAVWLPASLVRGMRERSSGRAYAEDRSLLTGPGVDHAV